MTEKPLRILFLAAEAVPFAKVGGLADVAGSLPKAIKALGHDVRLMIPRYGTIRSDQFHMEKIGEPFLIPVGPGEEHIHLVGTTLGDEVPAYLIWSEQYFSSRDRVYGFDDDAQRFSVFGRASLAALHLLDWKPDVIHANDWHTGLVPTWLSTAGQKDPFYSDIATLFTIHNLTYQGIAGRLILTFAQMEYVKHLPIEGASLTPTWSTPSAPATPRRSSPQSWAWGWPPCCKSARIGSLACSTGLITNSGTRPQTPTSPIASTSKPSINERPTRPPCNNGRVSPYSLTCP